jgi:dTMP kinase
VQGPLPARLVAIEGIDQAGKQTQTRLLAEELGRRGFRAKTLSFPDYNSWSGQTIKNYLEGNQSYQFRALCMLYSLNRWERLDLLTQLIERNDFLVANRYTPSGLAYGVAGGLNLSWLRNLDKGLPAPDDVLVIDVPVTASLARKTQRRDVHERDTGYLESVKRTYRKLSSKFGWQVIDGTRPRWTGTPENNCRSWNCNQTTILSLTIRPLDSHLARWKRRWHVRKRNSPK